MARRPIRQSGPGAQVLQNHRIRRPARMESLGTISQPYANGTVSVDLPTGRYTYYGHALSIVTDAQIVGETTQNEGQHRVKTEFLSKYVESLQIEINGTVETEMSVSRWLALNSYFDHGFYAGGVDGFLHIRHGSTNQYQNFAARDAFAMGTGNVDSLRIIFRLTGDYDPASMSLKLMSEYAAIQRPIAFCNFFKTRSYTTGGTGNFHITDIPISSDIARIFVFGASIRGLKVLADNETVVDASTREILANHSIYGRKPELLGDAVMWDFIRDQDHAGSLRSMEAPEMRARQARLELVLTMNQSSVPIEVVTENTGQYARQY